MRPFRFELEAVRALSEHAESSSRVQLAGELLTGMSRDQELAEATAQLEDARANIPFADRRTVINAWDLLVSDAYLYRRESARAAAAEAALLQEQRIEIHRNVLIEASRKRQALERLKHKRRDLHRAELERLELAELNEVALLLHDRRLRDSRQQAAG